MKDIFEPSLAGAAELLRGQLEGAKMAKHNVQVRSSMLRFSLNPNH